MSTSMVNRHLGQCAGLNSTCQIFVRLNSAVDSVLILILFLSNDGFKLTWSAGIS